jgi:hypothetical protein
MISEFDRPCNIWISRRKCAYSNLNHFYRFHFKFEQERNPSALSNQESKTPTSATTHDGAQSQRADAGMDSILNLPSSPPFATGFPLHRRLIGALLPLFPLPSRVACGCREELLISDSVGLRQQPLAAAALLDSPAMHGPRSPPSPSQQPLHLRRFISEGYYEY